MKQVVIKEKVDISIDKDSVIELCKNEIPGTRAMHHIVMPGSKVVFKGNVGYYHIIVLISGKSIFETDGRKYEYSERVTFVPAPDKDLIVEAQDKVNILEIQWDLSDGDKQLIDEYNTKFPYAQLYSTSIQYTDPNKTETTISRMTIPHRVIPRFAIGSVENYGKDIVMPHAHPMLDQFFFSFPENEMNLLINGEPIPMGGNELVHIPLGADHGVETPEGKHCHYMWIDFLPDNEKGLKRLDERHHITGTMRSFDK